MKNYFEITVYLVKKTNKNKLGYVFLDKANMICKKVPYGYKEIKTGLFIYEKNIKKLDKEYIINDNITKYILNKNGVILISNRKLNEPLKIIEPDELDYYNMHFINNLEINSLINNYKKIYKEQIQNKKIVLEKYKELINNVKKTKKL